MDVNTKKSYRDVLGLPPISPPRDPGPVSIRDEARRIAANMIGRTWKRYSMRLTFRWLKDNLIKAERSMTLEILRRLSPREAELIKDPVVKAKIRFRFGGEAFPPTIMYKIFTRSNSVHYYSGHRLISADTQAAVDSCTIMGVRQYSENLLREAYQNRALKISHADEVTNRLEFVQYLSSLDTKPAYMGGRNNGWRELNITPFAATQNLVYDIRSSRGSTRYGSRVVQKSLKNPNGRIGAQMEQLGNRKPRRLLPNAPLSGSKSSKDKQRRNPGLDIQNLAAELEQLSDEDVDPLFAWANNLSYDNLADYVVGEVSV
ncbi:hypothetical protein DFS34DRAFT_644561 [Phlyctochytrium arcticum]|nr:hypothetical protein DFS34DRAFT_644561 [Phlyctochytrium arcticum]